MKACGRHFRTQPGSGHLVEELARSLDDFIIFGGVERVISLSHLQTLTFIGHLMWFGSICDSDWLSAG